METPTLYQLLENARRDNLKLDSDNVLLLFMEYVESLGISLYPAQEEAILEQLQWKHVILNTPTGSGKSMVALALHFQAMAEQRISWYTAPTKALVNEKFFWLCDVLGPQNVGLLTGDGSVNPDAPVICCTAEILSNRALREDDVNVDYVVMDEFHYYGDKERGVAWQIPLITMRDAVFLLMSATLGDTSHVERQLSEFTDRDVAVVKHATRPVPLEFHYVETHIHQTIEKLVEENMAPVYLVSFTQKDCAEQAQNLMSINVCSKEEKQQIAKEIETVKFDTPYGKEFSRFVRHGIGVHHAGLLPRYRRVVEKLSQLGLIKVISGTDTLGVGVNIPIRTVVIRQLYKYNGEKNTIVTAREFHQIAGRAGRKGFDDQGTVVVQAPEWVIENRQIEQKLLKNPHLKKKLRKKSPPPHAIPWDEQTLDRLKNAEPEALQPQFQVTHGMIINLLQSNPDVAGGGYGRLVDLIYRSHGSAIEKSARRKRAAQLLRSLRLAGIIDLVPRDHGAGKRMVVSDVLQQEFSLNYSLSLYLVQTIELLEDDEEKSQNMLTLVETILEDPKVVLRKQIDKLKGELVGRLKAEGVPYEERMEELDKVEHPKPMETFINETFRAFSATHPWVGGEHIHAKNVAREMFENYCDFNYYVQQYGLARSEGVLLRYLSQVYKAAVQTVPVHLWTDVFEDILAYFHGLVRRVDSTLVEEWSLLMGAPVETDTVSAPARAPSVADDPRAFRARVRNEMHTVLSALASKDYEQACTLVHQTDLHQWTPDEVEKLLMPYFEEHAYIDVTPAARLAHYTNIVGKGNRVWEVHQKIIDPNGDQDWTIVCMVDLSTPRDETGPLVELVTVA
jgi:superfamily II RNA helicase